MLCASKETSVQLNLASSFCHVNIFLYECSRLVVYQIMPVLLSIMIIRRRLQLLSAGCLSEIKMPMHPGDEQPTG